MLEFIDRWAGFHDRVSRREVIALGGIGALALGTANGNERTAAPKSRGTAKQLIFLSLFGGPPHQETYDIQHEAPSDLRGEFQSIPTSLPDFRICEYMPKLAKLAHNYTVIRSMTHKDNGHESAYYALMTGRPHPRPNTANARPTDSDFPNYGSTISYARPTKQPVPNFVLTGGLISTHIGQTGGFLGPSWAPFVIKQDADKSDFDVPEFTLFEDVPRERFGRRQSLLGDLTALDAELKRPDRADFSTFQERAFDMLTSPRLRAAFNVAAESPATRAAYGDHPFGQNLLLSRRLVEAGVPVVQVNYRNRGDGGLDTHHDNFNICKGQLLPKLDGCISALLIDLEERGLLDETLVVASGEFGRTPRINQNAGRDHWGGCSSLLIAGGGVKRGYVHGSSNRTGAYPATDPIGPWDLYATIMHCCGIDPQTTIHDSQGRPHRLCEGTVIESILEKSHI